MAAVEDEVEELALQVERAAVWVEQTGLKAAAAIELEVDVAGSGGFLLLALAARAPRRSLSPHAPGDPLCHHPLGSSA